jgi:indolepyruvate ferredoxin oxidoreductase beta subunit
LIPKGKADLIISVEPMEALRYIPYLSKEGWIITNTKPFINFAKYPDINKLMDSIDAFPRHIALNADETARNIGAPKSANMVILGAASMLLEMDFSELENGIKLLFKNKSDDVIQSNISALRAGREYAIECLK